MCKWEKDQIVHRRGIPKLEAKIHHRVRQTRGNSIHNTIATLCEADPGLNHKRWILFHTSNKFYI